MLSILLASLIFLPNVSSHSWVVKVGLEGGKSRGGTDGGDLTLQRYFCPLPNLVDCQPDPKHDIVLTDDALRPCRANVQSNPRAKGHAGDNLYMSWMGNGHVDNGQSDGSCVKFMLAPYNTDPDFDSFTTIPGSECRDYWYRNSEGFLKTDANITIPANTPPGKYTVLWYWNFTEFWFSSCSDIDILPPVGPTTSPMPISSTIAPVVTAPSPTKAPVVATSRPTLDDVDIQDYLLNGCTSLPYPTLFCQSYLGPSSYCKYYNPDECGRAYCQGGDFLLSCPQTDPPTTISVSSPSPSPSPAPTTPSPTPASTTPLPSPAPTTPSPSPAPTTPSPTPAPTTPLPSPAPTTPSPSPASTTPSPSPAPTTPSPTPAPTTPLPSPAPTTPSPSPASTTPSPSPAPTTPSPSPAPTTPSPSPAPTISGDSDMDIYLADGCNSSDLPKTFCRISFSSYCKGYQADSCGRSVCHGQAHSSMKPCV